MRGDSAVLMVGCAGAAITPLGAELLLFLPATGWKELALMHAIIFHGCECACRLT